MSETTQAPQPSIVLHHLNDSRSQRILWLLEELELPYQIKKYERVNLLAPKELKKIHPLGKAPVLTDGECVVAESGTIVEYIIGKYGAKYQPSNSAKVSSAYWTHYAEGSLMPHLVNKFVYEVAPSRTPILVRPIMSLASSVLLSKLVNPAIKEHVAFIESELAKSKSVWFAGDDHPTSADFMMIFPLEDLAMHLPEEQIPKIAAYVKRVHSLPTYRKALEKGGEYSFAKL